MVVRSLVEGINLREVIANWTNMICYNIYHDPDTHLMSSSHKVFQVLFRPEVSVHLFPVRSPVSMVASIDVLDHR